MLANLCPSFYFNMWRTVTTSVPEAFTFGRHFTIHKAVYLSSMASAAVKIFNTNVPIFPASKSVLHVCVVTELGLGCGKYKEVQE